MVKSTLLDEFSVDRGPDCLFVKIRIPDGHVPKDGQLAEELWSILSKHFTYRLVLEMEEVDRLPGCAVDELLELNRRIQAHGGMLRLCGLSEQCRKALDAQRAKANLPRYHDRTDAVVGHHATLPG